MGFAGVCNSSCDIFVTYFRIFRPENPFNSGVFPPCRMQPVSGKSQLFESLKAYLNKSNRLQPIIGLNSIIECVKVGKQNREPLYWCKVCVCQLSKADIRNHILGSHHRFNYIKAWHPHLVSGWQEKSHLSEMAWPLMEIAKTVERDEGPGDAQLLEVEDPVFQKIATQSENDAVTMMDFLRDTEAESDSHYTSLHQSQRTVLLEHNQHRLLQEDMKPQRISGPSHTSPPPPVQSDVWLENVNISHLHYPEPVSGTPVVSENNLQDDYTGDKPLIGLYRVVEYRSEDGYSKCFLCHCCRVRSEEKDIVDHLTSSSHLFNYLVETRPEELEVISVDGKNNYHLESLARKVAQEEGRGDLKVVNVPESLCRLLTGRSYHWCIQMLRREWTHSNIHNKNITHKGPRVTSSSSGGIPQKHTANPYKWERRSPKNRRKKATDDTVFNVCLPLTGGAVVVERTHSNVMTEPPSPDWDLAPSPEMADQDLDNHPESFSVHPEDEDNLTCGTMNLHGDPYREGQDADCQPPARNLTVTLFSGDLDGYPSDRLHCNQHETGTNDYEEHEERQYSKYHGAPRPSKRFYESCQNEDEGLLPARSHTHDWSPIFMQEGSGGELLYNSTLKTEKPRNTSYSAVQYYAQQHLQSQYIVGRDTSLWGKTQTCLGSTSSVPAEEQRPMQTYMDFPVDPSAAQSYWAQPSRSEARRTGRGSTWSPDYSVNYQTCPLPLGRVGPTQSNASIQPGLCYLAPS